MFHHKIKVTTQNNFVLIAIAILPFKGEQVVPTMPIKSLPQHHSATKFPHSGAQGLLYSK